MMNMGFAGWSLFGVLAAVAIVAGIVLLVLYAVRRGLVNRELDGTINAEAMPGGVHAPAPVAPAQSSRALGTIGALLLVIGLGLGVLSAVTGWGGVGTAGDGPTNCAGSWSGCPQVTSAP